MSSFKVFLSVLVALSSAAEVPERLHRPRHFNHHPYTDVLYRSEPEATRRADLPDPPSYSSLQSRYTTRNFQEEEEEPEAQQTIVPSEFERYLSQLAANQNLHAGKIRVAVPYKQDLEQGQIRYAVPLQQALQQGQIRYAVPLQQDGNRGQIRYAVPFQQGNANQGHIRYAIPLQQDGNQDQIRYAVPLQQGGNPGQIRYAVPLQQDSNHGQIRYAVPFEQNQIPSSVRFIPTNLAPSPSTAASLINEEPQPFKIRKTKPKYSDQYTDIPKNYAFSYAVKDRDSGDDFSHTQAHNGQATKGEYRVRLPDGRVQVVSYTADSQGYRADVTYDDEKPAPSPYNQVTPSPAPIVVRGQPVYQQQYKPSLLAVTPQDGRSPTYLYRTAIPAHHHAVGAYQVGQ